MSEYEKSLNRLYRVRGERATAGPFNLIGIVNVLKRHSLKLDEVVEMSETGNRDDWEYITIEELKIQYIAFRRGLKQGGQAESMLRTG